MTRSLLLRWRPEEEQGRATKAAGMGRQRRGREASSCGAAKKRSEEERPNECGEG